MPGVPTPAKQSDLSGVGHSLREVLAVAKCPGQAGAGAIVARGEARRGTIIPIAIECDVPF